MVAYIEAYDPVTLDWIKRVNTAGDSVTAAARRATDVYVTTGRSDGWWTKQKRVNLFAAAGLTGSLVPLLVGGGNAIETNHNFVSGDYTLAGGLVGNTSTKYLQTGWVPSTELVTSLDAHAGVIALAAGAGGGNRAYLGGGASDKYMIHWWISGGTLQQTYLGNAANGIQSYVKAAPDAGHIVRSNTAAIEGGLYQNSTLKTGSNATTNALSAIEMYIFGWNNGGSPSDLGGHTLGGYHFGTGLSATDVTNMYNAINTFCTAIGRTLP